MKKILLIALATLYSGAALAAGDTASQSKEKSSSQAQGKDTAAWVSDEKADNTGDKKLVKKITPKAEQGAKEEADKKNSASSKDQQSSK